MVDLAIPTSKVAPALDVQIRVHEPAHVATRVADLAVYLDGKGERPLSYHPAWLLVLQKGLRQTPYCLEAVAGGQTRGFLLLSYLRSVMFGRFLVSLPYLNYGGAIADDEQTAAMLVDRAVRLAEELKVRYLELRHEHLIKHAGLNERRGDKVHMRLHLPGKVAELWDSLSPKVRNQVRKGQKAGLTIAWGGRDLLPEFHSVFARNMRDLGTPVYGRKLFGSILDQFGDRAELCVVRAENKAVAGALLLHGRGVTEVPSASSLREYNHTSANMLMYWQLLERAVQRKQSTFDFGRSSADSSTYRFKKQWGAEPAPAEWQYHVRAGSVGELRTNNPKYQRLIAWWKRLPLGLTRLLGPWIVRGIP
jgi:FemAB-related protein (PEP-CTERM system-associated)